MPYLGYEPSKVAVTVGQGVIDATHIQDASITTADLGNDSVTPIKIDDDGTGFQMGSLGLGTSVSGSEKLTVGGTASFSGAITGTLATASQTNITGLGTITTGVWQGTVIASAYLDSDTAHLSTAQTFSGAKTFSSEAKFTNNININGSGTRQIKFDDGSESEGAIVFDEITDGFIFKVGGTSGSGKIDAFKIENDGDAIFAGDVNISTSSDPALTFTSAEGGTDDWKIYIAGTGLKFRNTTDSNTAFELTEGNDATFSGGVAINGASIGSHKLVVDNGTTSLNRGNSSGDILDVRGLNASQFKVTTTGATFNETLTIGTQQGSKELMTNRARMRHIDGVADANASFSHGDLYVNHISTGNIYMQRDTFFGGHITVDTGGTSIIYADGNNNSGDDGRIILKGHTAGTSRAYAYFNNGVTSGGLNWYVGCLRGSNAFSITCGNDDSPGYGGGSHNDTVMSIDGNRKIGIGNNPGSQKLRVYNDATDYTVQFQNNQGDGAVLDLYASASDDHAFDPIFKVRTDAQDLFMIDNKGNWYSGDNFVSNPWDLTSGEGGLYFQTGYNNSGQTFAIANNQDRGYAVIYCNAINADASDGRHIQWMNDGTPAGHVHFNSSNSVAYNTTQSDKTLKKNFDDWTENILDSFDKINPQLFHFKIQDDSEEKVKGFIAQEMVDKFPEAYPMGAYGEGDNKTTKYHFNPSGMVVYLMKAVKELSDKIKILEGN